MSLVQKIWEPVHFDERWNNVATEKFDNLRPSWDKKRIDLCKNQEQYDEFIKQLKRKQAIDTGIIERMYDLNRGVTETFIKEGFVSSYLQHGDTNVDQKLLMNYLQDNFYAMDFIFDFVKSNRELSIGYIKELHSLITRHQDTIDAIDSLGKPGKIPLLRGEFKKMPNNPKRPDGVICEYCPPLQVDSEMDNLIRIFNYEIAHSHILARTAFLHHAFVQIHPFQDGNGRIARLLASFVLIKDNLFPFSLDRDEKNIYIGALEDADKGNYQNLIDVIAKNQIKSIEQALNLETVGKNSNYNTIVEELNKRLVNKNNADAQQRQIIDNNMHAIFALIKKQAEYYKDDLRSKLGETVAIEIESGDPSDKKEHYYSFQIARYAKKHKYYFNSSLPRRWTRIRIKLDDTHKYQLVLSLHHYGYDNSAFAIGAFIEKQQQGEAQGEHNEILIPLGIPPLVFYSEKDISTLKKSICDQIEDIFTATLAYIAEELS
ncbi:MAG: Fic family protein [Treponema sp.]|jgi:Fic family protein|nr:Fic family protein [Treponema sp.]